MRRAARTDTNHAQIVKALRDYGCKVFDTSAIGAGFPDLLIGIHGRLGLVEVKGGQKPPSARRMTEAQVAFWDEWAGCPMALVQDVDSALRFARVLAFDPGSCKVIHNSLESRNAQGCEP